MNYREIEFFGIAFWIIVTLLQRWVGYSHKFVILCVFYIFICTNEKCITCLSFCVCLSVYPYFYSLQPSNRYESNVEERFLRTPARIRSFNLISKHTQEGRGSRPTPSRVVVKGCQICYRWVKNSNYNRVFNSAKLVDDLTSNFHKLAPFVAYKCSV